MKNKRYFQIMRKGGRGDYWRLGLSRKEVEALAADAGVYGLFVYKGRSWQHLSGGNLGGGEYDVAFPNGKAHKLFLR